MIRKSQSGQIAGIALLLVVSTASPGESNLNAVFLFGYTPKSGQSEVMEKGYREHLKWHRDIDDPLPWFGWTVITGDHVGDFVDGTFGISYEAFDNRPDPAADIANARKTFLPHVSPRFRQVLRFRPNLSSSTTLMDADPTPLVQAAWVESAVHFHESLKSALELLAKDSAYTIETFERISGGKRPGYLLLVPMNSIADFPAGGTDAVGRLLELASKQAGQSHTILVTTALWRYRPELSLLPGNH